MIPRINGIWSNNDSIACRRNVKITNFHADVITINQEEIYIYIFVWDNDRTAEKVHHNSRDSTVKTKYLHSHFVSEVEQGHDSSPVEVSVFEDLSRDILECFPWRIWRYLVYQSEKDVITNYGVSAWIVTEKEEGDRVSFTGRKEPICTAKSAWRTGLLAGI